MLQHFLCHCLIRLLALMDMNGCQEKCSGVLFLVNFAGLKLETKQYKIMVIVNQNHTTRLSENHVCMMLTFPANILPSFERFFSHFEEDLWFLVAICQVKLRYSSNWRKLSDL